MRIDYRVDVQLTPGDGQIHVTLLAGAAVKVLLANGWNPRERRTKLRVHARQAAAKTDTARQLGTARYDPAEGRVILEAATTAPEKPWPELANGVERPPDTAPPTADPPIKVTAAKLSGRLRI
jgi:hypothetical protein